MSRTQLLMQSKQAILIDIIWLFWTVTAFLIFGFLQVFVDTDPTLAIKGIIGFSLLVGGTAMSLLIVGYRSDNFYSIEDFVNSLGYLIVSILAIFMVNVYASTLQLSSVPISSTLFIMLMGISEEAFFRGFLLTMFVKMTGSSLIAVGLSSVVGMAYHAAVYGASNTNLAIVFGSFAVLGFAYVMSGYRLSIPMTAHALINMIAGLGG